MRIILLVSLLTTSLLVHAAPVRVSYDGQLYDITVVELRGSDDPLSVYDEPSYGEQDAAREFAELVGAAPGTRNQILGFDPDNYWIPPVEGYLGAAFVYDRPSPILVGPSELRGEYSAECYDPSIQLVRFCYMVTRHGPDGEFLYPGSPQSLLDYRAHATVSVVPLPAAAGLFGTGLLGLVGEARRKLS